MTASVLADTNVISYSMNEHTLDDVYRQLIGERGVLISFMTVAEVDFGMRKNKWAASRSRAMLERVLTYPVLSADAGVALLFSRIRSQLFQAGTPVEDNDLWIAATALRYELPLVTHNPKHFRRIPGLQVESALEA